MPLIYDKPINSKTRIGIWEATEDEDFFISSLGLADEEVRKIEDMRPHRRKEWLSSRMLCHKLSGCKKRAHVIKDENGKPSLHDHTDHISISHSHNRAAVIISDTLVGIDVQKHEEKIVRIQHKFISDLERDKLDRSRLLDAYHIFWGAKECMYKAYGKKELDFKKHMHLYPFKIFQNQLELKGWVKKDDVNQSYTVHTDKLDNYYLTYSILDDEAAV